MGFALSACLNLSVGKFAAALCACVFAGGTADSLRYI
jgi:hypothetical protein